MNRKFYEDCIMEDRKSRRFIDFSEEQWFKDFMNLTEKLKENKIEWNLYLEVNMSIRKLLGNDDFNINFSLSKPVLDFFVSNENQFFINEFLEEYKGYEFGNCEDYNQKKFPIVNLPIVRMMDYFLEKKAFKQFSKVMDKLEYRYIVIWFELTSQKIDTIIRENLDCKELWYIFTKMGRNEFEKYFRPEYIPMVEIIPFEIAKQLINNSTLTSQYIDNEYFMCAFKGWTLKEQIDILELLEYKEYDVGLIKRMHSLLNKTDTKVLVNQDEVDCKGDDNHSQILLNAVDKASQISLNAFEMSDKRLKEIKTTIENSSYFKKFNVKDTDLWKAITLNKDLKLDLSHSYYPDIMNLYKQCKEYATESIVKSLYPLNQLSSKVVHLYDEHYNILARVRTMWEMEELSDTFKMRTFCSFSILTEKNMSHYGNSVLYGYYTNVTSDLIAHIYPMDSLSDSTAEVESELTKKINKLLDIDDLNEATLKAQTYNQLCIRTKTKKGEILWPDCIVCIEEVDEKSKAVADYLGLNIVVLHKKTDTIERNEDIYKDLQ